MLSSPPINFLSTLEQVDDAIDTNGDLADEILKSALHSFGLRGLEVDEGSSIRWQGTARLHHLDKARSTIRQLYRDWSSEGNDERQESYGPIVLDLDLEFAPIAELGSVKVLVPGAGLGRLVFELCRRGYCVEGNEISWHQIIAGNWVLNHTHGIAFELFPFAAEFSNVISREQQLKKVRVPDIDIANALKEASGQSIPHWEERMIMTAGEFVELYEKEKYDGVFNAVVTVFFIDTAPNLIRYIDTVRHCLRPGGIWINLGPLLWHFESRGPVEKKDNDVSMRPNMRPKQEAIGIGEPGSFELTNEEVLLLIENMGFCIEKQEIRTAGTGYIQNSKSMLQSTYRTSHWIARKKA